MDSEFMPVISFARHSGEGRNPATLSFDAVASFAKSRTRPWYWIPANPWPE
ncbi:MAG: hypothetical protein QM741_13615 [Rudaea sp.]|uniref:hypothetical protein n=1 Tax=Rudaea sp. TaxID=2136325 RepID=UPI0039E37495